MALDQKNIQGDIWPRLPKKSEIFLFCEITNSAKFKEKLSGFSKHLTSAHDAQQILSEISRRKTNGELGPDDIIDAMAVNLACSAKGLKKLEKEDQGDDVFRKGMYNDMVVEGLDREAEWHGEFKGRVVTEEAVQDFVIKVLNPTFKNAPDRSVKYMFAQTGVVLQHECEHFGWADVVSQPLIKGLDKPSSEKLAPPPVKPGIMIVGAEADTANHPAWAKDGSFMVFRRSKQLVPESIQWVTETFKPQATNEKGELMMGALSCLSSRLMGRWRDVVSLEQKPHAYDVMNDVATLMKSNDFDFKDNDDLDDTHAIVRRGIPYGPQTQRTETLSGISMHDRGLLFVSYQSNLRHGFRYMQKEWSNKFSHPAGKDKNYGGAQPGLDPIIGQWAEGDEENNYANVPRLDDPRKLEKIKLERIVIAEGGECFFTSSFSGIKDLCK
ncbi:hypothetical protein P168DRAFT_312989 [Aspergillus campestris IBT 28561]|uniref:Dyp-type peroxidase n=1 Tax=Aspergillus campestris (strain IBT 28561) TaxID=1392248 RepID=A0A2I1CUC0_ASPC2|nr:uncharacterized protein P168DRAFT_312989 [Aspergillus campestris IBT 28561]PKY01211.1 hypothetical protein P168DRAFT_312989 [Aspergillus campestris IBT 28561]